MGAWESGNGLFGEGEWRVYLQVAMFSFRPKIDGKRRTTGSGWLGLSTTKESSSKTNYISFQSRGSFPTEADSRVLVSGCEGEDRNIAIQSIEHCDTDATLLQNGTFLFPDLFDDTLAEGSELIDRLQHASSFLQPNSTPKTENLQTQSQYSAIATQPSPLKNNQAEQVPFLTPQESLEQLNNGQMQPSKEMLAALMPKDDHERPHAFNESQSIQDLLSPTRANDRAVVNQPVPRTDPVLTQTEMTLTREKAAEQVSEKVQMMFAKNLKHVDIRLDPPELGRMQIKMSMNADNTTSLHFTVTNAHSKDILDHV